MILRRGPGRKEERLPQAHDHRTTGSIDAAKGILYVLDSTIPSTGGRNRGGTRPVGRHQYGDRYRDRRGMPTKIRASTDDGTLVVKVMNLTYDDDTQRPAGIKAALMGTQCPYAES